MNPEPSSVAGAFAVWFALALLCLIDHLQTRKNNS